MGFGFLDDIVNTIGGAGRAVANTIGDTAKSVLVPITDVLTPITNVFGKAGGQIIDSAGKIIDRGLSIADRAADLGLGAFQGFTDLLKSPFFMIGVLVVGGIVVSKVISSK